MAQIIAYSAWEVQVFSKFSFQQILTPIHLSKLEKVHSLLTISVKTIMIIQDDVGALRPFDPNIIGLNIILYISNIRNSTPDELIEYVIKWIYCIINYL